MVDSRERADAASDRLIVIIFVPTNAIKAAIKGGGTGALLTFVDNAVLANTLK